MRRRYRGMSGRPGRWPSSSTPRTSPTPSGRCGSRTPSASSSSPCSSRASPSCWCKSRWRGPWPAWRSGPDRSRPAAPGRRRTPRDANLFGPLAFEVSRPRPTASPGGGGGRAGSRAPPPRGDDLDGGAPEAVREPPGRRAHLRGLEPGARVPRDQGRQDRRPDSCQRAGDGDGAGAPRVRRACGWPTAAAAPIARPRTSGGVGVPVDDPRYTLRRVWLTTEGGVRLLLRLLE